MVATIFLEKNLWQRIQFFPTRTEENGIGFLFGLWSNKTWHGMSIGWIKNYKDSNFVNNLLDLRSIFPAGLTVGGIVYVSEKLVNEADVQEFCQTLLLGEDIRTNLPIFNQELLIVPLCSEEPPRVEQNAVYSFTLAMHNISKVSLQFVPDGLTMENSLILRLKACSKLNFELGEDIESTHKNLHFAMSSLKSILTSDVAVFCIKRANLLLRNSEQKLITSLDINKSSTCEQLYNKINSEDKETSKKNRSSKNWEFLEIDLLMQTSGSEAVVRTIPCVPIIHYERRVFKNVIIPCLLSTVSLISKKELVLKIPEILSRAISSQLDAIEMKLKMFNQGEKFYSPRPYHFHPLLLSHIVTVVYPNDIAEESLEFVRRDIHEKLLLPKTQPLFKKICKYSFSTEVKTDTHLTNVHVGLPSSGFPNGEIFAVTGTYAYYHYMQDRFDDKGWGCAYRSLQTVASWFQYQGYTERPVPSHREIQQSLVDTQEKPASFLGSRQWIGSLEVSSVLNNLLGVTSKILPVNSGEDLAYKGRELAVHFKIQGTPIMIGGGVLAHTILGVDYDNMRGNLKFLVLDPHYTGDDDLKLIQNKGWCGWKGPEFWDKVAHYNLCMPQRPSMI